MIIEILVLTTEIRVGEKVKIMTTLPNYTPYIERTDDVKNDSGKLHISRENGTQVIINPDYIVAACIVKEL